MFEGSENPLVYQRDYVHSFSCRFELEYFPFDIQTCLIEMILPSHMQGYVELFPGKDGATFSGIKETLQYQVKYSQRGCQVGNFVRSFDH